jgi:aspartate aminotransferase-like enzyme
MGESSRHEHVVTLLSALEQIFRRHGWTKQAGPALAAALQAYAT